VVWPRETGNQLRLGVVYGEETKRRDRSKTVKAGSRGGKLPGQGERRQLSGIEERKRKLFKKMFSGENKTGKMQRGCPRHTGRQRLERGGKSGLTFEASEHAIRGNDLWRGMES